MNPCLTVVKEARFEIYNTTWNTTFFSSIVYGTHPVLSCGVDNVNSERQVSSFVVIRRTVENIRIFDVVNIVLGSHKKGLLRGSPEEFSWQVPANLAAGEESEY